MKLPTCFAASLLIVGLGGIHPIARGGAGDPAAGPSAGRDGQHDFDFNFGVWKTHIRRISDPFSASSESWELNGTVVVRKIWGGRAQLEEIEADGPKGHWEGLTLFLYDPAARQWSQTFVSSAVGSFGGGLVGSFKDGVGELFSQDTFKSRSIFVRGRWSDITPNSHHFEEDYSDDGGTTWHPAFIANLIREPDTAHGAQTVAGPVTDPQSRGFDFAFGTWKEHSSRLLKPLTGSKDWVEMEGASVIRPIWGGKANLVEYHGEGPKGHLDLLALRVYNPTAHQWSVDFANSNVGKLGDFPGIGEFRDGRIDFYDRESLDGKAIMVRFSAWGITPSTAQSEQAFSDDGGKTWEVNWINRYTRSDH